EKGAAFDRPFHDVVSLVACANGEVDSRIRRARACQQEEERDNEDSLLVGIHRPSAYALYGTARSGLAGVAAPLVIARVLTVSVPSPLTVMRNVSMERGAGPKTRTPAREYVEP